MKYIVNTASISEVSIEDLEKALDEAAPDKGGVLRPALVLYLLAALAVSQDISPLFRERA